MNAIQTAVTAIQSMTNDELNQVIDAVKLQRTFLTRRAMGRFSVGDEVKWSGKRGYKSGTILKIARKYITVKCGFESWRVPANMLSIL